MAFFAPPTSLFLKSINQGSSREFLKTDWIGETNSSNAIATSVSNADVYLTQLKNFDTGAAFWIVRHNDSTSTSVPILYHAMLVILRILQCKCYFQIDS